MEISSKVSTKEKLACASISFGYNSISGMISMFLIYFYTDVAMLPTVAVSAILFAVRFFDGAVDPFLGNFMDRHHTRFGKYKGYLIYCSIPFSLLSALVFMPFPINSISWKIFFHTLVFLAWSFAFSIIESANLPLLVVISKNSNERYSVNSSKILGGIIATLVARYVVLELVDILGGTSEYKGYFFTALMLSVVAFFAIYFPTHHIVERNESLYAPLPLAKSLSILLRDKKLIFLLLFYFSSQMASSLKGQATIYYMKYIVDRKDLTSIFLLTSIICSLLLQPVIVWSAKKIPIKFLIIAGYIGAAASVQLMGFAGPSVGLLMLGNIFYGIASAFPSNLLYIYVAQLADRSPTGNYATLHSLLGLALRLAMSVSGALISLVLSASNYIPNAIQEPDSLFGIKTIFVTLTSIMYILAAVFAAVSFKIKTQKEG